MSGNHNQVGNGGRRAVFFDRDGTLNEEVGYLCQLEHFRVYPFAAQAVRQINEAGLLAIVVTNQSGVGHGYFTEKMLAEVHELLERELRAGGAWLDAIFYCPHHPASPIPDYRQECTCRKPGPGMAHRAAEQFGGIDFSASYVVGDRRADVELAHAIGATSILVLTGFGRDEWQLNAPHWPRQPHHVAENVHEAVRWILAQVGAPPA